MEGVGAGVGVIVVMMGGLRLVGVGAVRDIGGGVGGYAVIVGGGHMVVGIPSLGARIGETGDR